MEMNGNNPKEKDKFNLKNGQSIKDGFFLPEQPIEQVMPCVYGYNLFPVNTRTNR